MISVKRASPRTLIQSKSPSFYWALDGGTGATDLSGNARNGTGGGGVTIGGSNTGTTRGNATDFDGTDDRVTSTYSPYTAATFTVLCHVARDTNTTDDTLWAGDSATTYPSCRLVSGGNDVRFRVRNSDTTAISQATWTGAWTPGTTGSGVLTVIFNSTADTAEAYVNGTSAGVVSGLTQTTLDAGNFLFGARAATFLDPLDGKAQHVAAWERALSAAEISQIAYSPPRRHGLR